MKQNIRVLIVDDEEQFAKNLARILKVRGYEVSTAFSGHQAVYAVKYENSFDVVVLDVKMPGMDGISALEEIKKQTPETEVIMLTGHATLSSGAKAMRKGAYDYLMKPCDIEDLIEKIKEAYEAENIKRHPVLWPRKMVREIPLHAYKRLKPEASAMEALQLMRRQPGEDAVEAVYVLDNAHRIEGVLTKRDLLSEAQKAQLETHMTWQDLLENPQWLFSKTVGQIMKANPVTTQANCSLTEAANQMIMNNLRCMPVLRAGKMVGIIRMQDIFQYVEHETE